MKDDVNPNVAGSRAHTPPSKRPYQPPGLQAFGKLQLRTQGTGNMMADAGSAMTLVRG